MAFDLLRNGNATGNSVKWPGGVGAFRASGTAGGATITLQYLSPDGTNWAAMGPDTTLTSLPGGGLFTFPPGDIRCAITGGSPVGISAAVDQVGT